MTHTTKNPTEAANGFRDAARLRKAHALHSVALATNLTAPELESLPDEAWGIIATLSKVPMPSQATRDLVAHMVAKTRYQVQDMERALAAEVEADPFAGL